MVRDEDVSVKTSIMLSAALWKEARLAAVHRNTTPSALVAEGLRLVLQPMPTPAKSPKRKGGK